MAVTKISTDGMVNYARYDDMRAGYSGTSRMLVWGTAARLYSDDAITWTATSGTFYNAVFVANSPNYPVTVNGRIICFNGAQWAWSYDGITFLTSIGVAGDANATVYFWGNTASNDIAWSSFYSSTRNHVMREYSGYSGNVAASPFNNRVNMIANNGVRGATAVWVLAMDGLSQIAYSTNDGQTWTQVGTGSVYPKAVMWGIDKFLTIDISNTGYYTSTNGSSWTSRTFPVAPQARTGVRFVAGQWFLGGASGALYTSPDGITWTSRVSGAGANAIYGFGYAANLYIAVGAGGYLATSPDGVTWTARSSGVTSDLYVVGGI